MSLEAIAQRLSARVDELRFEAPVTHVYNPLQYAWKPHRAFLRRYGEGTKEVCLVGMNPGPFGMAQTGVPFGEVNFVRDWMKIEEPVAKPPVEHPKRLITGFACTRSEVSGARLWGWAQQRFGDAEAFFARFFVLNFCPLIFLEESGRNRTPDKLKKEERAALTALCDEALRASVEQLGPRIVIGVGAYARKQAERALAGLPVEIGQVLHPSPASPIANRGWAPQAEAQFAEAGIALP